MKHSLLKNLVYTVLMLLTMAVSVELISIIFVHYRYRSFMEKCFGNKITTASGFIIHQALQNKKKVKEETRTTSIPSPFRVPDSLHGFRVAPGSFEVTLRKKKFDEILKFKYYVTVLPDGSRYVGRPFHTTKHDVYVFGDSFMFGEGVNDKQTFTFMLQSKFRDTSFHLFANPAHSLSNSYLEFQKLAPGIGEEDVIILGYADYYGERHVASPNRIRYYGEPWAIKEDPAKFKHLRASLVKDSLYFDKVPLFCEYAGDYCQQPEPRQTYIDSVTTRLINGIARNTKAKVYLLHFLGKLRKQIKDQLDPRVMIIHAASEDFDYKYMDNVMNGFDSHPGPYWHHAIFKRIYDTLTPSGKK